MRKLSSIILPFFLLSAILGGCLVAESSYKSIAPGSWRGVLRLENMVYPVHKKDTVFGLNDVFRPGELPFNFEVKYLDDERFYVEIINGTERIRCDSIVFGHNKMTARDTLRIFFPEYQSYIRADVRGADMQGEWVVTTKDNYRIPFYAHAGRDYRFTYLKSPPKADLSGKWASLFGTETDKPDKAIGEFKQDGNHLSGTFRTETGDYRYLDGTIQDRKFWLSCFDGAHAFLFSGAIQGDSLQGEFQSGTHFRTLWTAWRDEHFELGNPDSLTTLKQGAGAVQFNLTTPEGQDLQFPSAAFDGKVGIFTIMGTWCPNCRDEQAFLVDYLRTHPQAAEKLKIVGFAFERDKEPAQANAHLIAYKQRLGIPFDLVYAGAANTAAAESVFPVLSKVSAFPTMIIVDKKGKVRQIHTGFDGPATSRYADFTRDFDRTITELTQE